MARLLVQTVSAATVETGGETIASIGGGLLIYVGIAKGDSSESIALVAKRVAHARLLPDTNGRPFMVSVVEAEESALVVSNFTLCGDLSAGRKPSWSGAARAEDARHIFARFVASLAEEGVVVEEGAFGAEMFVNASVHGPLNLVLETAV